MMTRLGKAIYEDLIIPDLRKAEEHNTKTIALNLLAMGMSTDDVSKATGLPKAEVATLAAAGVLRGD